MVSSGCFKTSTLLGRNSNCKRVDERNQTHRLQVCISITKVKSLVSHCKFARGKYLVLVFYPLAFTYVCPTEILSFSDQISKFHAIGAEVVACSVDSLHSKLAW